MVPSLGAASVPGRTTTVRTADGATTVGPVRIPADPHLDGPGWHGLLRWQAGALDVLIDDVDPFRYPAATDLRPRRAADRWDQLLSAAWSVLQAHHPWVAAEIAAGVSVITPITTPPGGAASSSSPEVFGTVAMSLPTDPVRGAELLAHEIQHVKLGALAGQVPLTQPDDGTRYYAPWRPDPRPLAGLLQGAYAYLGVSGFWRCQRLQEGYHEEGDAEYSRWRAAAAMAVETLRASGRLTTDGLEFVAGMARTLDPWQREQVSATAQAAAERAASEHLSRWRRAHSAAAE
jgi:HEXXH motif-containing protein